MPMTLSGNGTITGLVAGGLPDATITGSDLASGATVTNLGYTPINPAGGTMTGSLNLYNGVVVGDPTIIGTTWRVMDSIAIGNLVVHRRSRRYDSIGASPQTHSIFQYRQNNGWAEYFFRVHMYEAGYLGTGYRSATVNMQNNGTNLIPGGPSYSPWWRYESNSSGALSNISFTGTGPTGGGTDVGWYDITATVTVNAHTSAHIILEYASVDSVTVNGTFNSKGQLNLL